MGTGTGLAGWDVDGVDFHPRAGLYCMGAKKRLESMTRQKNAYISAIVKAT